MCSRLFSWSADFRSGSTNCWHRYLPNGSSLIRVVGWALAGQYIPKCENTPFEKYWNIKKLSCKLQCNGPHISRSSPHDEHRGISLGSSPVGGPQHHPVTCQFFCPRHQQKALFENKHKSQIMKY